MLNMFSPYQSQAMIASRITRRESSELLSDVSTAMTREFRQKAQLFAANTPDLSPLAAFNEAEMRSFAADGAIIKRAYNQMYYRWV